MLERGKQGGGCLWGKRKTWKQIQRIENDGGSDGSEIAGIREKLSEYV